MTDTPHTGSATIEQLLEMSLADLQAMSDSQVLAFLKPALIAQPPETSSFTSKPRGKGKPALGFKKAPTAMKLSLGKKKGKSALFLELEAQKADKPKLTAEEKKKAMFAEMAELAGAELPENMK